MGWHLGHELVAARLSDTLARRACGKPAAYVDKLLIEGKGGVHHIWGCDHYKTTLNAHKFKQAYKKRADIAASCFSSELPREGDRQAASLSRGVGPCRVVALQLFLEASVWTEGESANIAEADRTADGPAVNGAQAEVLWQRRAFRSAGH